MALMASLGRYVDPSDRLKVAQMVPSQGANIISTEYWRGGDTSIYLGSGKSSSVKVLFTESGCAL